MNKNKENQYFELTIRVSKKDSAFLYFQLEANEGLCFYSTLEHREAQDFRDIHIRGHISLYAEFNSVIESLKTELSTQFLISHSP